ncbi:hypothetical protein Q3G72_024047 [Acer saccharum]|nr:hypothetical protein Q3G72_024047 [Acer saccharum]
MSSPIKSSSSLGKLLNQEENHSVDRSSLILRKGDRDGDDAMIDDPGGCILTHDPGSGKTSMIISLTQSFLTQYSHARPLVILLRGILGTWKREFQIWQMEDLPLLGFYTVEADNRAKQLEMLKKWVEQKSLLLLEYKQFSSIACDRESSPISIACQKVLLKQPSTLIPDEGHTPKNEDIDVLQSLSKVQIELVKKTETPTKPRESRTSEALIDQGAARTEGVKDANAIDPDQRA